MAASTNIGGVSISVSLSVKKALTELARLDKEMKKSLGTTTRGSAGNVEINNTEQSLAKTVITAGLLRRAFKGVKGETDGLNKSMSGLGNAAILSRRNPLAALSKGAKSLGAAFKSLGPAGIAGGVAIGVVAAAAVAAVIALAALTAVVVKLGKVGFESARELEVLNLSMEAITGSAAAAKQEVAALQRIAIESPFLTTSIINLDKFLLSQGVASGELREGLVSSVLDLAAALGLGDDALGSITYALAQVQARGYLSGDEMRQLANQFVPVIASLKSLPEFADKSTGSIRKMIEQGQISSTKFFEALIASTEKYEGIALRASLTVDGLLNKLEDVTRIRLGQSFIDVDNIAQAISPLGAVRDLLFSIVGMLEQIDWRPFAAALGLLTEAFTGPIASFFSGGGGDWLIKFFSVYMPNAIFTTAKWLKYAWEVVIVFGKIFATILSFVGDSWNALWDLLISFGIAWADIFKALVISAGVGFIGVVASIGVVISSIGALAGWAQVGIAALRALFHAMQGNWAGVAAAWNSGIQGAQNTITGFANAAKALPKAISAGISAIDDLGNAFRRISKIEMPNFSDLDLSGGFVDVDAPGAGSGGAGGGGGGGGGAAKTIDELAKIMDMLWDLTRRWRGMRSELEVGFLGKDGFIATIDQIYAMGQKLDEAFISLGRVDVADWIFASTEKLVELATKRNELTVQLTDATANLSELVKERDAFAAQIRSSAIKFAAALNIETESIRTFEQQSDRGFFIETEQKKQKDLVTTLRERAKALKDFYVNIKKLKDAGLDDNLLSDLLTAGPDQSGETAAALAAGGKEMVDSVNVIYKDIEKTADLLAEFGAKEFHQAGVDQAQALVDGLTADLEIITTAAKDLTDLIYETVLPFAKEMEEVGAAGGAGLAGGLSGSVPGINSALGSVGGAVGGGLAGIDDELTRGGNAMDDTFTIMGDDMIASIADWAESSIEDIERWQKTMTDLLEGWKIDDINPLSNFKLQFPSLSSITRSFGSFLTRLWGSFWSLMKKLPFYAWEWAGLGSIYRAIQKYVTGGNSGASFGQVPGNVGTAGDDPSLASVSSLLSGASAAATGGFTAGVLAATRAGSTSSSSGGSSDFFGGSVEEFGVPIVKVYIGDEELRGIVRTEVVYVDTVETTRVLSGRRA